MKGAGNQTPVFLWWAQNETGDGSRARAPSLRMRRFYVALAYRRTGVGRALVTALLAGPAGRIVTANAAAGSEAFWESFGFLHDRRDEAAERLRVSSRTVYRLPGANRKQSPSESGIGSGKPSVVSQQLPPVSIPK